MIPGQGFYSLFPPGGIEILLLAANLLWVGMGNEAKPIQKQSQGGTVDSEAEHEHE